MANNQHHDYQYLSVTCSQVRVSIYQQKFPILYIDAYLNIYINYILNIPMINIEFPILYVYYQLWFEYSQMFQREIPSSTGWWF